MEILVMGLLGSGKMTFANKLAAWAKADGYTVDRINADVTVFMDTIPAGQYADINAAFIPPTIYDIRIA